MSHRKIKNMDRDQQKAVFANIGKAGKPKSSSYKPPSSYKPEGKQIAQILHFIFRDHRGDFNK